MGETKEKLISSVGYDEQEMIRNILKLHTDDGVIDLDPTYSIGNFYKHGLPQPQYRFDKFPKSGDVRYATADRIPLPTSHVKCIMFDPPFVMEGSRSQDAKDGSCIIGKRFTSFRNFDELKTMYSGALKEFCRVLQPKGTIIFKCQDVVVGQKNHFTHCWVMAEALKYGLYPKDLFILLAKNRLNDGRKQQHARKYHCYYWVFKKEVCKVDYTTKDVVGVFDD